MYVQRGYVVCGTFGGAVGPGVGARPLVSSRLVTSVVRFIHLPTPYYTTRSLSYPRTQPTPTTSILGDSCPLEHADPVDSGLPLLPPHPSS
jgi:hypothetical protein